MEFNSLWVGWLLIGLGLVLIAVEVVQGYVLRFYKVSQQKKKLSVAKRSLADAQTKVMNLSTQPKQANVDVLGLQTAEANEKKASDEVAKAESEVQGALSELIKKLPWVVIVGLILIYLGLCVIGAPLPFKTK